MAFFFCKTKFKKKNLFCISDKPEIALFNFWKTGIIQSKILLWIKKYAKLPVAVWYRLSDLSASENES